MRRYLATAALLAILPTVTPATQIEAPAYRPPLQKTVAYDWYVRLDGRWYEVDLPAQPTDPFIWIGTSTYASITFFTMHAFYCRRANGQAMVWTPQAVYYGAFLNPIWDLKFPITYHFNSSNVLWFEINTNPGDMICDGEVDEPEILPPEPVNPGGGDPTRIFGGGFEEYRLFCDSFDPQRDIKCNPGN